MNQLRGVEVEHRIFHLLFKTNRILFPCKNLNHLRSQSAQVKVGCREEAHLIVLSKDNQAPVSKVCNPIKNKVKYLVSSNLQLIIDFIILLIKRQHVQCLVGPSLAHYSDDAIVHVLSAPRRLTHSGRAWSTGVRGALFENAAIGPCPCVLMEAKLK